MARKNKDVIMCRSLSQTNVLSTAHIHQTQWGAAVPDVSCPYLFVTRYFVPGVIKEA